MEECQEGVKSVLKVSELNKSLKKNVHTRRACMENMTCWEVGMPRACRRSGKNLQI